MSVSVFPVSRIKIAINEEAREREKKCINNCGSTVLAVQKMPSTGKSAMFSVLFILEALLKVFGMEDATSVVDPVKRDTPGEILGSWKRKFDMNVDFQLRKLGLIESRSGKSEKADIEVLFFCLKY